MSLEGFTIWFTGPSGSGKTTLASAVHDQIVGQGYPCEVLDSGRIREILNRSLGFTREDIEQTLMRIGYECRMLNRNGVIAIVAAVSPYRDLRDRIRGDVRRFVEVHCRCPIEVLLRRDKKGLLARAQRGEVQHVAGINSPYEEPLHPEVVCDTADETPEAGTEKIISTLQVLGYVAETAPAAYTAREEETIKERFRDLGYI